MLFIKTYSIGEFAKQIGKSTQTLRRWDIANKFNAHWTPNKRRYYTQDQLDEYFGCKPSKIKTQTYIYARVSSYGQRNDLKRQIQFLEEYTSARGYQIEATLHDIGSGMNYKRRNWNRLVKMAINPNKRIKVVVAYPDRFIRFGFQWFNRLFNEHHCSIEVVNHHKMSPNQELVSDLISIIQVFSSKLYGLRKYKNTIRKDKSLR